MCRNMPRILHFAVVAFFCASARCIEWKNLDLFDDHIPMFFKNNPRMKRDCDDDISCPFKNLLSSETCWGYESNCKDVYLSNFTKDCPAEKNYRFWKQVDFGYLKMRLEEMESRHLCESSSQNGSSLICTKDGTMCRAKNLYMHLTTLDHRQDGVIVVSDDGAIGGVCELKQLELQQETRVKRSLSTWGYQLQSYKALDFDPFGGDRESCDVVMTKPVVFVQLDAVGNLYHHFCDFFNLYLTQHANNSWFGTDVQIVRWNDHARFRDPFMDTWNTFTQNGIQSLHDFVGRRICIPDATFAFLPRMSGGLYYSTYLEKNCKGSRMVKAFSDHILHRMNVNLDPIARNDVIKVTFLQRGGSQSRKMYRRVINIDQLVKGLKKIPNFEVKVVSFDHNEMSFIEQLRITRNTDIFIGMHGAGLTHFLFLPDWAVAFELYNCGDIRCYRDLAALKGIHYLTWEDESKVNTHNQNEHERYGGQTKFWNFSFDVEEFIRLVKKARDYLLQNERFRHLTRENDSIKNHKPEL